MTLAAVFEGRERWTVEVADCRFAMSCMAAESVDAIVCDPPYGLGTKDPTVEQIIAYLTGAELDTGGDFMGRDWAIPSVGIWTEAFRVLKPGGHLLAFAGTRTMDIVSIGIRAAGFINRDTIAFNSGGPEVLQWQYGSGFPKSLSVAKALGDQDWCTCED